MYETSFIKEGPLRPLAFTLYLKKKRQTHLAESRTFCSFHTILLVPPQNYRFCEISRNIFFFLRNKQREAKKRIETIMWINQRAEWENILNGTCKG